MATFSAFDGTTLAYHVSGQGEPLVCLPGGPMQDSAYLGELGGLGAHRRLIMLDLRGTGESAEPADPESYRCDRLADDVEALRAHLGLERMDVLGHSAGANLALRYLERHPDRVARLVLATPSLFGAGVPVPGEVRRETALLRRDEPWFEEAFAALEEIVAGRATEGSRQSIAPFSYGRWDAAARAHRAAETTQRNQRAAAVYGSEGAFEPDGTRAALAAFHRPVLVVAGELDLNSPPGPVAELTALFPDARLVVQPGAGHFPWLDDGPRFVTAVEDFLG
ncbi:alpha/beta fold hydrolase [Streptomyces sp. NPDC053367]|uniref:alpha/beta fold hydrolase n=1 Tax=Streptomyces sp. NPDC053367 TaxID=3365700 RepID=UPI0037D0136B